MPEKMWKTREVAKAINVNPSTVQRWIKYFHLTTKVNAKGHFEMTDDTYDKIKFIHSETKQGKKLKEIVMEGDRETGRGKMVPASAMDEKIDMLIRQVEHLDRQLNNKADEVVEYQVLNQRKEINELNELISHLSSRLKTLEESLQQKENADLTAQNGPQKKRRLAGIFSF